MISFKNYLGIIGAIFIIAGGMSPMLHIPIIGNWNYWDIDSVLASIVFVLAILGLIASVFHKQGILRFSGWAALIVVLFTLIAVYFKVNDYFSFIPFKKLAKAAASIIRFRGIGWILLIIGSVLMIIAGRKQRLEPEIGVV
ncbi:hypothetical protein [Rubrolithibacter danxiaensis]|uniref:hypothetical protein n=1 Tax=Rubrolithibacter danxiaensis TaxID=3390805 RepID=UPI003BF7A299